MDTTQPTQSDPSITKLKDMAGPALAEAIRTEMGDAYTEDLASAIALATRLHGGQTRKDPVQGRVNTPYIEHCLRGVLRLVRLGCRDRATLIASVLHDTVEDCAHVFALGADGEDAAREALRTHIMRVHGPRIFVYVDGVTNPYQPLHERRSMSDDDKFALYRAKVEQAINSSLGVYLVKLSDYIDNAGSLHHTPAGDAPKAQRLARKYLPLIEVFRQTGSDYANADNSVNWNEIDETLARIGNRLDVMI